MKMNNSSMNNSSINNSSINSISIDSSFIDDPFINSPSMDNLSINDFMNVVTYDFLDGSFINYLCDKYKIISDEPIFIIDENITQQYINKMFLSLILRNIDFTIIMNNRTYYRYENYINNIYLELFLRKKISYNELLYINKKLLKMSSQISSFIFEQKYLLDIQEELNNKNIKHQINVMHN